MAKYFCKIGTNESLEHRTSYMRQMAWKFNSNKNKSLYFDKGHIGFPAKQATFDGAKCAFTVAETSHPAADVKSKRSEKAPTKSIEKTLRGHQWKSDQQHNATAEREGGCINAGGNSTGHKLEKVLFVCLFFLFVWHADAWRKNSKQYKPQA